MPFQTRWIYKQGFLNKETWEYGTFSLYATEILLGIIIVLSIIYISLLFRKQESKKARKQILGVALVISFILLLLLNCSLAMNSSIAFYKLTYLILAAALFFIILLFKLDFKKISWAIILSALIQSVFAIQQFVQQKIIANKWLGMAGQDPQTLGVPVVEAMGTRWLRTFGSLPHPNILAGFLVISLFLIIGLYASSYIIKHKRYLSLIFVINFIGLFTTLSRAAILTLAVMIILLAFFARKNKPLTRAATKFVLISVFIFILFLVSFPDLVTSRALGESRVENISNVARIEQYQESWSIFKNNWLIGTGLGNYTLASYQQNPDQPAWVYQPVHNTYLLIINELGILGIILALLYLCLLVLAIKKYKSYNTTQLIAFICLLSLSFLALFDHYFWSFYFGMIFTALIFTLPRLLKYDK